MFAPRSQWIHASTLMPSCGKLNQQSSKNFFFFGMLKKMIDIWTETWSQNMNIPSYQMWLQLADLYFYTSSLCWSHTSHNEPRFPSRWQYLRSGKRAWLRRHRDDVHGQHALPRCGGKVGFVVLRTQVLQLGSSAGCLFFFFGRRKKHHSKWDCLKGSEMFFFEKDEGAWSFWSFVLIRFCKRLLVEGSKEQNFERFCGWLILFFLSEASAFLNNHRKGVLWIKKFTTNGPLSKLLEFLDTQVFRSVGPVGDCLENCGTTIGPPKVGILTPSPGYGTQCSNSGISSHFEEPVVRVRLSGG